MPTITSLVPSAGIPGGHVTINGTAFGNAPGGVWIGAGPATVDNWTDSHITATISSTATSGSVYVYRSDTNLWSSGKAFTITRPAVQYNGLTINTIQVYDDATLQQMLNAARAQLSAMQFLDQAGISSRIGTIQGASLQQSGFALNVGGPPLPGIQTTANTGNTVTTQGQTTNTQQNSGNTATTTSAGTNSQNTSSITSAGATSSGSQTTSTTSSQLVVTGPSTQSTAGTSTQSQTTGPSTQTVTTLAQQNPAAATVPTTTAFTLPSSFSPSAGSILNQQLELTYEITGYEMLLEGSLSDRYMFVSSSNDTVPIIRRRTTIGVPVTIAPCDKCNDAVAEVILEVTTADDSVVSEPPRLTAILPRDKTYNVAAITDSTVSLGGGVVTHVMSVGVSWLWGHKTYYVVEDQDTVAIQLPQDPHRPTTTRFGWQIHPVLGRKTVQGGMRILFAQLAFPVLANVTNFGSVHVITRWKKLDRKRNIVSDEPIKGSEVTLAQPFSIPKFDVKPRIQGLPDPMDNGDGTLAVRVESAGYLTGTVIRIGTNVFSAGSPNTLFDSSSITFTAPSSLLAREPAYLVDRSGEYRPLIVPFLGNTTTPKCFTLGDVQPQPINASSALVTVHVNVANIPECQSAEGPLAKTSNLIAVVGNKVFGYRDAPLQEVTADTISFIAPMDLLRNSPHVTVKRLLWGPRFSDEKNISVSTPTTIDKAVLTLQSSSEIQVALIGGSLKGLTPILPAQAKVTEISNTAATVVIPAQNAKDLKQMVFKTTSGDLLLVMMPTDPGAGGAASLQPHAPIKTGKSATITISGTGLDKLDHVEYNNQKLKALLSQDRKSVKVELPPGAVAHAGTPELVFVFTKPDRISYPIAVFDTKVDLPQPQQVPTK